MAIPYYPRPNHSIPDSDKDDQYYRDNAYWLLSLFHNQEYQTDRSQIKANQKIQNGDVDEDVINYMIHPYGTDKDDNELTPQAMYHNFPLMQPILDAYQGDFLMDEFKYSVEVVNKEAYLEKEEKKVAVMAEKLVKPVVKEIQQATGIQVMEEEVGLAFPDDLEALENQDFREMYEDAALNLVKYNELQYDVLDRMKKGLVNYLNGRRAAFRIRRINNDPVPEPLPIEDMVVVRSQSSDLVEDAHAVAIVTLKSVPEVLTLWAGDLDKKMIECLKDMESMNYGDLTNKYPGIFGAMTIGSEDDFYQKLGTRDCKMVVVECFFKGERDMYVKKSPNKYDEDSPFVKCISIEKYKELNKNKREGYKRIPYTDNQFCVMIGHHIIATKGREKDQRQREQWGLGHKKFDIVGVWGNPKTAPTTIITPLQLIYNALWFHLERLLGQMGGKAIEVWEHHKPDGWTNDQWLFNAKERGFVIKQWKEEDADIPDTNNFKGVYDFGLSPQFGAIIQFMNLIESTARRLVGQNPARTGELSGEEGLGISKLNFQQSVITTLPIFHDMRRVINSVLNAMVDKGRKWYAEGEKRIWFGGKEKIVFEVTKELKGNEYGVFMVNNSKETIKKAKIEEIALKAMSSGGVEFFDYIMEVINAETSVEAQSIARKGFEAIRKANQLLQQGANQASSQMAQAQAERNKIEREKMQVDYKKTMDSEQLRSQTKLKETQMKLEHDENVHEVEGYREESMDLREKAFEMGRETTAV